MQHRPGGTVPPGPTRRTDDVNATAQDDTDGHRARLRAFLERPSVRNAILAVIIFNAITLGLSTSPTVMASGAETIHRIDQLVVAFFLVELTLKLYAYGLGFFRSGWNFFDAFVILIGLLPQTGSLRALRALRVIRALRLLSVVPQMRAVVQALFDALPGMGAVIVMLSIVYYVFGVMATIIFGEAFPDWFGTLGRSLYSLFQIMTLESWSMGIVRPVMDVYPYAWAFFVPFIVVTAFAVLNLFVAIIVNAMSSETTAESSASAHADSERLLRELQALRGEVRDLRQELGATQRGPFGRVSSAE
jgi:voltage-gated sodium channel